MLPAAQAGRNRRKRDTMEGTEPSSLTAGRPEFCKAHRCVPSRAPLIFKYRRSNPMAEKKSSAKPKATGGFMAPLTPDTALAAIVGNDPLPRTEVTKRVWESI